MRYHKFNVHYLAYYLTKKKLTVKTKIKGTYRTIALSNVCIFKAFL